MSNIVVTLPGVNGPINCTVKRPTLGLVKLYRKHGRVSLDNSMRYNGVIDAMKQASEALAVASEAERAALEERYSGLVASLDTLDDASFEAQIAQCKCVLELQNPTMNAPDGSLVTNSLDHINWDDVTKTDVNKVLAFFGNLING